MGRKPKSRVHENQMNIFDYEDNTNKPENKPFDVEEFFSDKSEIDIKNFQDYLSKTVEKIVRENLEEYYSSGEEFEVVYDNNLAYEIDIDRIQEYKIVAKNLKELIRKSNYNQSELAKKLGISDKTLSNIISNRFNTSLEVAYKICILLGRKIEEVFVLELDEINLDYPL